MYVSSLVPHGFLVYLYSFASSFPSQSDAEPTLQVSVPVARSFIESVTEKAVGTDVIPGVEPEQQLVKVRSDPRIL
jgi:hypothetical protein